MTTWTWKHNFLAIILAGMMFAVLSCAGRSQAGPNPDDLEALEIHLQGYAEPKTLAIPLATDGVALSPNSGAEDIYDLYADYRTNLQPVLITTDLIFHTLHKVLEQTMKTVERAQLPLFTRFSTEMCQAAVALASQVENDPILAPAARQLAAYFAVPSLLLGANVDLPDYLSSLAAEEVNLIMAHKGFDFSKVLPHKEDYSQYQIRGHYAGDEDMEIYFRAAMWYGRRMFRFDETRPEGAGDPIDSPPIKGWWRKSDPRTFPAIADREILSACMLVRMLEHTTIGDQSAMLVYQALKAPFDHLVGQSEDIDAETLSLALVKFYGKDWTLADLIDPVKRYAFAKEVATENAPAIDSSGMGRKGLTLLGQRALADAAIFQKLVHSSDNPLIYNGKSETKPFTQVMDGVFGEVRGFPRGLDLMAVLGSKKAENLLAETGDDDYQGYEKTLNALKKNFGRVRPQGAAFRRTLSAMVPLFSIPKQAPDFMKSETWQRKSLNTALGVWTELRHNTVLYAKQSYTPAPRGGTTVDLPMAYLEPNPEAYRRMAGVAAFLNNAPFLKVPDHLRATFQELTSVLERLTAIAESELNGKWPKGKDAGFLATLSGRLKSAIQWPESAGDAQEPGMALAADVHTRMPEVLTQAVGFPGKIIVRMSAKGQTVLFFGGIYTYYEFKTPYGDRMTDEKWRQQLRKGPEKAKPLLFKTSSTEVVQ